MVSRGLSGAYTPGAAGCQFLILGGGEFRDAGGSCASLVKFILLVLEERFAQGRYCLQDHDRLLYGVDAQMYCTSLARQLSGNRRLSGSWQAAKDSEHV